MHIKLSTNWISQTEDLALTLVKQKCINFNMHNISKIVLCLRKKKKKKIKVNTHAQLTEISNQAIYLTDFISVLSEQPGSTYQRGTTRLVLLAFFTQWDPSWPTGMLKIRTGFTDIPYGVVCTASVWLQQVLLKAFHIKGNLVPLIFFIEILGSGV